uniref:Uncharacterized protein n=1 Tax=Poecilia reticulata TaxID=8081 RepID=A0A3P9Q1V4_POERE
MPREKSYRRSLAARRRRETAGVQVGIPATSSVEPAGDIVKNWPSSSFTNHCHKLVIPEEICLHIFVLLIGASHLRSFADGIKISDGCIDFGVMCTPGASVADLRIEAYHAVVPRQPDAVCVTAPSNNLTASLNPDDTGEEFEKYLLTVVYRLPKVFCTFFPLRLTESLEKQNLFQQEFHRLSCVLICGALMIHLSDDHGMPILQKLMWMPTVQNQAATGYKPRFVPRIVMKGEERRVPSLPSSEWRLVRSGRKVSIFLQFPCSGRKVRVVHHKIDGTPVALRECSIPLNPFHFSDVHTGNETKSVEHQKKPAVLRTKLGRRQVCESISWLIIIISHYRIKVFSAGSSRPLCQLTGSSGAAR